MTAAVLFICFLVCVVLGIPIAISMGISSIVTILTCSSLLNVSYVVQGLVNGANNFSLLAIPLFCFAGELMGKGGISRRLVDCFNSLFGRKAGGLAIVTVCACMFFAAISGSGPATVVAIGGIMIPGMIKQGYDCGFVAGLTGLAGAIGIIIPPSIPMVVYGVAANVSVGDLFLGGVIPGFLIGFVLIGYSYFFAKKHNYVIADTKKYTGKEILTIFWNAKWSLLVPVIILGGIYGGIFTPTEAAGVAVVYGFLVGTFLYKELKWKDFVDAARGAMLNTAVVMVLIGASSTFSRILTLEGIPELVANFLLSTFHSKVALLLVINVVLLIAGALIDCSSAIIILTPLLLPAVTELGMDPLHFGIMMIVNLGIGFVTPPVGPNLFLAMGIADSKLGDTTKQVLPMCGLCVIVVLLITFIPQIATFLPSLTH